jgi:alkylation response protein AidB-like acyl-CoA dehydrogenase
VARHVPSAALKDQGKDPALTTPVTAQRYLSQFYTALARLGRRYASQSRQLGGRAESVLTPRRPTCHLPGKTARWSTTTQIYEGTNQIQRMVMARQLLKG